MDGLTTQPRRRALVLRRAARRVWPAFARRFPAFRPLLTAPAPLQHCLHRSPIEGASSLLVCLPGIDDLMEDYERQGVYEKIRAAKLPLDVVAADAHFGYYSRRTILDRLRDDIVLPARAAGYRRIALAGISMGGLGALAYGWRHPDEIASVIAIAPYLGRSAWQEHADLSEEPELVQLWAWLRGHRSDESPAIYLAYGEGDRYAAAHRALANLLPPRRVMAVSGGHDWATWRKLWDEVITVLACDISR